MEEKNKDEDALMLERLLDVWTKNEKDRIINERELINKVSTNLMLVEHQRRTRNRGDWYRQ